MHWWCFLTCKVVSFCLHLSCFLNLRSFYTTFPIGTLWNCVCPCCALLFQYYIKHKPVIEPNSLTECWYSTKQEVCFLTQSRQCLWFVLLEFFLLCTTTGLVLVSIICISDRIADVPWDQQPLLGLCLSGARNCNPVSCRTRPHDSCILTPQKNVLSRSCLYLKSRFPLLFLIGIPNSPFKISQILHPATSIVDPHPSANFWKRKRFPTSVHLAYLSFASNMKCKRSVTCQPSWKCVHCVLLVLAFNAFFVNVAGCIFCLCNVHVNQALVWVEITYSVQSCGMGKK